MMWFRVIKVCSKYLSYFYLKKFNNKMLKLHFKFYLFQKIGLSPTIFFENKIMNM